MQDRTTQYAADVLAGKIIAGDLVKLACKRHLDDIEKSKAAPYKYYFDVEQAERIIEFAETLTITEGEEEEQVECYAFQCFILGNLNGWRTKTGGHRRFRTSYVQLGRQNGKSFLNGILAAYYGNFEKYKYGQIYCTATKKDQSLIVFNEIVKFIRSDPDLDECFCVHEHNSTIDCLLTHSKIKALSGDTKSIDGFRPYLGIVDEYHAHKNDQMYKLMEGGIKKMKSALISVITTAGFDLKSPCYALYEYCVKVLKGIAHNDSQFIYIAQMDETDDMAELRGMQEEFDMLMEMEEDDDDGIKDSLHNGKVKKIEDGQKSKKYSKAQVCKAFVNRIVCGLRKRAMPEEDQEIMDSFKNMMKEGEDEDGGFTVPEDVSTDIIELRRTENDLEQYVNVEKVATMSGSRVIEVDADSTPWGDVDEGGEFEEEETPNLKQIKYAIKKKGGILKTTRELLQDTAVNILAYLNKWIAKKSRATRNAAILNVINTITKGKEVAVATFDDFKDVFNVKLDPAIAVSSIVLTNQDGFNYMDKLKDKDGKYIMQPDPTDATKTLLFGKYPVKVVSNKTLKSTNVLKGGSGPDKNDVTGYKYPVYMGDLKEAVTLFDREKMTIELSTEAGDLWAKDLTGIKVRDRFDVQSVDETAVVKGEISVAVAG